MKVVAFNGSPRPRGNTSLLIGAVFEELNREGIRTELVHVGGHMLHGCTACYKCRENGNRRCALDDDILNDCVAKMDAADGIILGSPVYVSNMTAAMKALIERAAYVARHNGDMFRRKVGAGVVAVRRAGSNHVLSSLNYFFLVTQMIVPGANYWNVGIGREPGEVLKDTEGMQTMQTLGHNMAWLLKRLHA